MKDFYFLLDGDIIHDVVEYPNEGYVKATLDQTHLPAGINAGYYRLSGNTYTLDETLKAQIDSQNKPAGYDALKTQLDAMQKAMDDMILGGVN